MGKSDICKTISVGTRAIGCFFKVKKRVVLTPNIGYANYNIPFEVHTGASQKGLGAILYQRQEGKLIPISFASRGLKRLKRNTLPQS